MMKSARTANTLYGMLLLAVLTSLRLAWPAYARDYGQTVTIEAMEAFTLEEGETIHGDLIVMGGKAHVLGQVEGNLVVVEGAVTLGATGRIEGDALAVRGVVEKHPEATVAGEEGKLSAADLAKRMAGIGEEDPGPPPTPEAGKVERPGDLTNFGSPINVPPDEVRIGDVMSMGGPVDIQGDVRGDVVCFGGPVTISGDVSGDVVTFGGPTSLQAGSRVHGDLVTFGGPVNRHPDATVDGESRSFSGMRSLSPFLKYPFAVPVRRMIALRALSWTWGTISALVITLLVILLAPQATQVVADRISEQPGQAAVHGVLALLLFLPVCILLAITCVGIIGIPILFVLLVFVGILGTVAVSLLLGQRVAATFGWSVSSMLGLAIIGALLLRALAVLNWVWVLGIIPALIGLCVLVLGLGGALMTRLGTRPGGTVVHRSPGRVSITTHGASVVIDGLGPENHTPPPGPSE